MGHQPVSTISSPRSPSSHPTMLPSWGISLKSPRTKLGDISHHHPQTKPETRDTGVPSEGDKQYVCGGLAYFAALKPHWRPWGLLTPFIHIASAATSLPAVSARGDCSGYLVFPGAGCMCCHSSSLQAELRESRPGMGPCSQRAPRGQRGTSHAQSWLRHSSRDQLIP